MNKSIHKPATLIAMAGIVALVLSGCASSESPTSSPAAKDLPLTKLTFQLNSPGGGYNSGYELAVEKGYYEDAGLDVTIEQGNGSSTTAQLVASGQADIAFADASAVMKLVAEGAPIKIIGTILQGNPNEVEALKSSGIKEIADLKGKKVALPNGYAQTAMFPLVLDANGLELADLEVISMPAESMIASLLQGQVDAILGSMDNFRVQLENQGAETVNLPFIENGAPTVAQSIIASESFLAENEDVAKAFVAASLKGWSDAVDSNEDALAALKAYFPDVNMEVAPGQLDATEYLMCANGAEFVGKATPEQWDKTVEILSAIGILPTDIPAEDYYTYDYLPEESELLPCPLS